MAAPGVATITEVTPASGQVTISLTADDPADTNYACYRKYGEDTWSAEDIGFSVTGDGDIVVTGLDDEYVYQFMVYARAGAEYSPPSTFFSTPTGSYAHVASIISELTGTIGSMVNGCYWGRRLPERRKESPFALIYPSDKTEIINTNNGTLQEFSFVITVGTEHHEKETGATEQKRAIAILDAIRKHYHRKRDFTAISNLQIVLAEEMNSETDPIRELEGHVSVMKCSLVLKFRIWEEYR